MLPKLVDVEKLKCLNMEEESAKLKLDKAFQLVAEAVSIEKDLDERASGKQLKQRP